MLDRLDCLGGDEQGDEKPNYSVEKLVLAVFIFTECPGATEKGRALELGERRKGTFINKIFP
jgi:hypothetical protein